LRSCSSLSQSLATKRLGSAESVGDRHSAAQPACRGHGTAEKSHPKSLDRMAPSRADFFRQSWRQLRGRQVSGQLETSQHSSTKGALARVCVHPLKRSLSDRLESPGVIIFDQAFYGSQRLCSGAILGSRSRIDASEGATPTLSIRFVSRGGIKGLQIKRDGCAHSVGPAISAWPLLAISTKDVGEIQVPEVFYNWRSSASGYSIFRITPARTLLLFGTGADCLSQELESTSLSISDQYKAIATTASPALLCHLVEALRWRHRNSDEKVLGEA